MNLMGRGVHYYLLFTIYEHDRILNAMKKIEAPRGEDVLVEQSMEALRRTGFVRDLRLGRPSAPGTDATLRIKGQWGSVTFLVEVKPKLTASGIPSLVHQRRHRKDERRLLATSYVPPALAEQLQQDRIEFVDAAGNAYLDGPIYLFIAGRKPRGTSVRPSRAARPAGLRLIYVLLRDPKALGQTQRDLAAAAGIALGAVPAILQDLRERGFLRRGADGAQTLARPRDLFFRWEEGYSELLRPKLFRQTCRIAGVGRSIADLTPQLREHANVLVGGELGAAILTKRLRPETATLHIHGDEKPTMTALRLLPDPQGTVTLLQTFGGQNAADHESTEHQLADPLLIHAELAQTSGDRAQEIGKLVLDQYILPRFA